MQAAQAARPQPFHAYSSRNKAGGRPHPIVFLRRDRALTMYWEHRTISEIAAELDISIDTVRAYVREARKRGDERAMRRRGTKRQMAATVRRRQILDLRAAGYSTREIARTLNVCIRLVQIRLRSQDDGRR